MAEIDKKKSDGWSKAELYVMKSLDEMKLELAALTDQVVSLRGDILILKVKAGVWGLIGAAIPTIAAILFILYFK